MMGRVVPYRVKYGVVLFQGVACCGLLLFLFFNEPSFVSWASTELFLFLGRRLNFLFLGRRLNFLCKMLGFLTQRLKFLGICFMGTLVLSSFGMLNRKYVYTILLTGVDMFGLCTFLLSKTTVINASL
jgi:hypothetical protein